LRKECGTLVTRAKSASQGRIDCKKSGKKRSGQSWSTVEGAGVRHGRGKGQKRR